MDATAHSVTLISIIVGLGLTELLLNLHRLIHARHRVQWDLLPLLWTATVLLLLLNYWWALALRRDGSELAHTAGAFGLLLVHPRGWDWFVTSAVLATAIVRTATQAVR